MAKYAHADVLDKGLNEIKTTASVMLLLKAYSALDSYATVGANAICTVAMVAADYTLSGANGATRVLTTAVKTGTAWAGSGATPNLHIAFTDGVARVLWVTDESSDQVVASANSVNFPAITYTSNQPI